MRMRKLGKDEISVIGYGAWEAGGDAWGPNPSEDEVTGAIRSALDAGITWIDTAEVYGDGRSEKLVGKAIKGRDGVFVATKLAPSRSGYHAEGVRAGIRGSMRRLKVDVIDLYQLHWPDDRVPLEKTWEMMARVQDDGLVRHIGLSNYHRQDLERCERIRHVDSLQNQLSMLHRADGPELFPWCESIGTAVLAYGPLAYGLLTGAVTADTEFHPEDWRSGNSDMSYFDELFAPEARARHLAKVEERLRPVAEGLGITLGQLALAWVVAQPGVTAAIAGSRNPTHIAENAAAGDVELDGATLADLERILED